MSRFCRTHGISRSQFYEIRKKALAVGPVEAALGGPPPRRRPDLATAEVVAARAIALRRQLVAEGWTAGPVTVRSMLLRDGWPAPAASTLARIFARAGLVTPTPQKRPKSSYRRFTFPKVHDCWQIDAFSWPLAPVHGRDQTATVFQVLDDHSRFLLASLVAAGETGQAAVEVFTRAVQAAGRAPVRLLTDNGSAFNTHRRAGPGRSGTDTALVATARTLGVRAITSRAYHPQTLGKNERVHATLQHWLRARALPCSHDELTTWLAEFDHGYNHVRPHQSLNGATPGHILATAEHAAAPTPPARPDPRHERPAPAARTPSSPTPPTDRPQHRRVLDRGSIKVGRAFINLGTEWAGCEVLILSQPPLVSIYAPDGTELRTVHLAPGKTYYGSGRPTGGPRKTRKHPTLDP